MTDRSDVPPDEDRPGAALAGRFLHQRGLRSPRPSRRIDELESRDPYLDAGDGIDAIPSDHSEEDESG